jgi:hypothetical protein
MKKINVWIILFSFNFLLSQGVYLNKENGFLINTDYGKIKNETSYGLTLSYSLLGYLDLSYSQINFVDNNDQNPLMEYLGRIYFIDKNRLFFSIAYGRTEFDEKNVIFGIPLRLKIHGNIYEGGLHYAFVRSELKAVLISIVYRYSDPFVDLIVRNIETGNNTTIREQAYRRSLTFENIYNFNWYITGIIFGPKLTIEFNNENASYIGLKLGVIFRH